MFEIQQQTASDAITKSTQSGEIVRCANTPANITRLLAESDDNAAGDELEFWGVDEDGRKWRVHVSRP
jgi:hypothetical protein